MGLAFQGQALAFKAKESAAVLLPQDGQTQCKLHGVILGRHSMRSQQTESLMPLVPSTHEDHADVPALMQQEINPDTIEVIHLAVQNALHCVSGGMASQTTRGAFFGVFLQHVRVVIQC